MLGPELGGQGWGHYARRRHTISIDTEAARRDKTGTPATAPAARLRINAQLGGEADENLQAYGLYLRGRSCARRLTRQDLEFALQMFENAVALDQHFALAYAAIANTCAQYHNLFEREAKWIDRARRAIAKKPDAESAYYLLGRALFAVGRYQ